MAWSVVLGGSRDQGRCGGLPLCDDPACSRGFRPVLDRLSHAEFCFSPVWHDEAGFSSINILIPSVRSDHFNRASVQQVEPPELGLLATRYLCVIARTP